MAARTVVSWDTETRGLDWWDKDQQAFLATWSDGKGTYVARHDKPVEVACFRDALLSATDLVAHNLSFDVHQTRESFGIDVLELDARLHDTELLSRVLHPEGQNKNVQGGHTLKNLAKVYLRSDAKDSEDNIKQLAKSIGLRTLQQNGAYYEVWRAYPAELETYALLDAEYTYALFLMLESQLKLPENARLKSIYELECAVAPVLIRAEQRGVALDPHATNKLLAMYIAEEQTTEQQLTAALGEGIVGEGSHSKLREALLAYGIPLYRKTPSGQLATSQYALQEFAADYPIIETLSNWRTAAKFRATYLGPIQDVTTVHTSYMQIGAWTGRMSCRRPNLQNIPKTAGREVREVFVPRPNHAFVVCDYDAIEIRVLAYYLGDIGYRQLIDDGLDPHSWMAAQIHGGNPDDYAKGTDGENLRTQAKETLFSIVYGAGAPRVSDMNQITITEAKDLIKKIKSSLPGYWTLQKRVRAKIEKDGYVSTIMGRKQVVNSDKSYVGMNALIQGSAADIMKSGLVNVAKAVDELKAYVLLVVHDEVVVEVPKEVADECLIRTEQALIDAYDLSPKLAVTGKVVTTNYADA